jgi:hypothetical protein
MREEQEQKLEPVRSTCSIAFAGNLNKSEFLLAMDEPKDNCFCLELWGKIDSAKQEKLPDFCRYHGVLAADEVPQEVAKADYGLVWDGSGKDEIEGGLGEYLRYNNSHKCGLYLASGIPAIVWSRSGMADYITKNQCGIVIDRLSDLSEALAHADHAKLQKNARGVAKDLRTGRNLSRALDRILEPQEGVSV